jgi:hypothetical protein
MNDGIGYRVTETEILMDPNSFLEEFIKSKISSESEVAGSPSFEIGGGGDARRSRKGLSVQDVERLLQAYPQDADRIKKMYLPGAQGTPFFVRGV